MASIGDVYANVHVDTTDRTQIRAMCLEAAARARQRTSTSMVPVPEILGVADEFYNWVTQPAEDNDYDRPGPTPADLRGT